jgi:hypothetical protein
MLRKEEAMLEASMHTGNVKTIERVLDRLDLSSVADRIVVVGGAAMAAFGIKQPDADIDIVVTPDLLAQLSCNNNWAETQSGRVRRVLASEGLIDIVDLKRYGLCSIEDRVTAFIMPFIDNIYPVDSETLISEAQYLEDVRYGFSPPARVLDWKESLCASERYDGNVKKHIRDIKLISSYILETTKE